MVYKIMVKRGIYKGLIGYARKLHKGLYEVDFITDREKYNPKTIVDIEEKVLDETGEDLLLEEMDLSDVELSKDEVFILDVITERKKIPNMIIIP